MRVLKFGGTSVGKPERMHSVAELINDGHKKIVVLSAVSGTTNALVEIGNQLVANNKVAAQEVFDKLYAQYQEFIAALYSTESGLNNGKSVIENEFNLIKSIFDKQVTDVEQRILLAQGEIISTQLFNFYFNEIGRKSILLPALDFMMIDEDNEPVLSFIEEKLGAFLNQYSDTELFITQGYICRNPKGEVDNLKRGGSDYTGTLVGAALNASEIQIWTDIDGMHNNDPRIVKRTFPIHELNFEEAAELAYFGAKILHPTCIRPAADRNVPVKLLNTMQPQERGTVIANNTTDSEIKAIAAKDGITVVKIKSSRMLLAYGFLRKVFEVFEKYKTPIDVITTSEVEVSMTIDDISHLDEIKADLAKIATLDVESGYSIICVVGDFSAEKTGIVLKVVQNLVTIPYRMLSAGGSSHNVTIVLKQEYKNEALNLLNEGLFDWK